jgi:hypothetical protein
VVQYLLSLEAWTERCRARDAGEKMSGTREEGGSTPLQSRVLDRKGQGTRHSELETGGKGQEQAQGRTR